MPARSSLVRLLSFLKPYRGRLVGAVAIALLASAAALAVPWVGRWALDGIVKTRDVAHVNRALILVGALWVLALALSFTRDVIAATMGFRVIADVREYLVAHAFYLPIAYFERSQHGDFLSRL